MHRFRRMVARQCVLNATHLLSYVSMSVDRCAGPCYLWMGRFSTSGFCVHKHWRFVCVCARVCEYDSQRCKLSLVCGLCDIWLLCILLGRKETLSLTSVPGHWGRTLNQATETDRNRGCVCVSEGEMDWQEAVRSMIACLTLTADVGEERQPCPAEGASSHCSSQWCR